MTDPGGGSTEDELLQAGVEHLQVAATELIAAARAFLDVAEDVVSDPERLRGVGEVVADVVRGARAAVDQVPRPGAGAAGVQHIDVR